MSVRLPIRTPPDFGHFHAFVELEHVNFTTPSRFLDSSALKLQVLLPNRSIPLFVSSLSPLDNPLHLGNTTCLSGNFFPFLLHCRHTPWTRNAKVSGFPFSNRKFYPRGKSPVLPLTEQLSFRPPMDRPLRFDPGGFSSAFSQAFGGLPLSKAGTIQY